MFLSLFCKMKKEKCGKIKEEEIKLKRQEQDDDGSSENWHLAEGETSIKN